MSNRDEMGRCLVCGDTTQMKDGSCFYCNWKGTTGPGADLKEILKNKKEKDNDYSESNQERKL